MGKMVKAYCLITDYEAMLIKAYTELTKGDINVFDRIINCKAPITFGTLKDIFDKESRKIAFPIFAVVDSPIESRTQTEKINLLLSTNPIIKRIPKEIKNKSYLLKLNIDISNGILLNNKVLEQSITEEIKQKNDFMQYNPMHFQKREYGQELPLIMLEGLKSSDIISCNKLSSIPGIRIR